MSDHLITDENQNNVNNVDSNKHYTAQQKGFIIKCNVSDSDLFTKNSLKRNVKPLQSNLYAHVSAINGVPVIPHVQVKKQDIKLSRSISCFSNLNQPFTTSSKNGIRCVSSDSTSVNKPHGLNSSRRQCKPQTSEISEDDCLNRSTVKAVPKVASYINIKPRYNTSDRNNAGNTPIKTKMMSADLGESDSRKNIVKRNKQPYLNINEKSVKSSSDPPEAKEDNSLIYNLECTMTIFEISENPKQKPLFKLRNQTKELKKWITHSQNKNNAVQNKVSLSKQKSMYLNSFQPKNQNTIPLKKDIKNKQKLGIREKDIFCTKSGPSCSNLKKTEFHNSNDINPKCFPDTGIQSNKIQALESNKINEKSTLDVAVQIKHEMNAKKSSILINPKKSSTGIQKSVNRSKRQNYRLTPRIQAISSTDQKQKNTDLVTKNLSETAVFKGKACEDYDKKYIQSEACSSSNLIYKENLDVDKKCDEKYSELTQTTQLNIKIPSDKKSIENSKLLVPESPITTTQKSRDRGTSKMSVKRQDNIKFQCLKEGYTPENRQIPASKERPIEKTGQCISLISKQDKKVNDVQLINKFESKITQQTNGSTSQKIITLKPQSTDTKCNTGIFPEKILSANSMPVKESTILQLKKICNQSGSHLNNRTVKSDKQMLKGLFSVQNENTKLPNCEKNVKSEIKLQDLNKQSYTIQCETQTVNPVPSCENPQLSQHLYAQSECAIVKKPETFNQTLIKESKADSREEKFNQPPILELVKEKSDNIKHNIMQKHSNMEKHSCLTHQSVIPDQLKIKKENNKNMLTAKNKALAKKISEKSLLPELINKHVIPKTTGPPEINFKQGDGVKQSLLDQKNENNFALYKLKNIKEKSDNLKSDDIQMGHFDTLDKLHSVKKKSILPVSIEHSVDNKHMKTIRTKIKETTTEEISGSEEVHKQIITETKCMHLKSNESNVECTNTKEQQVISGFVQTEVNEKSEFIKTNTGILHTSNQMEGNEKSKLRRITKIEIKETNISNPPEIVEKEIKVNELETCRNKFECIKTNKTKHNEDCTKRKVSMQDNMKFVSGEKLDINKEKSEVIEINQTKIQENELREQTKISTFSNSGNDDILKPMKDEILNEKFEFLYQTDQNEMLNATSSTFKPELRQQSASSLPYNMVNTNLLKTEPSLSLKQQNDEHTELIKSISNSEAESTRNYEKSQICKKYYNEILIKKWSAHENVNATKASSTESYLFEKLALPQQNTDLLLEYERNTKNFSSSELLQLKTDEVDANKTKNVKSIVSRQEEKKTADIELSKTIQKTLVSRYEEPPSTEKLNKTGTATKEKYKQNQINMETFKNLSSLQSCDILEAQSENYEESKLFNSTQSGNELIQHFEESRVLCIKEEPCKLTDKQDELDISRYVAYLISAHISQTLLSDNIRKFAVFHCQDSRFRNLCQQSQEDTKSTRLDTKSNNSGSCEKENSEGSKSKVSKYKHEGLKSSRNTKLQLYENSRQAKSGTESQNYCGNSKLKKEREYDVLKQKQDYPKHSQISEPHSSENLKKTKSNIGKYNNQEHSKTKEEKDCGIMKYNREYLKHSQISRLQLCANSQKTKSNLDMKGYSEQTNITEKKIDCNVQTSTLQSENLKGKTSTFEESKIKELRPMDGGSGKPSEQLDISKYIHELISSQKIKPKLCDRKSHTDSNRLLACQQSQHSTTNGTDNHDLHKVKESKKTRIACSESNNKTKYNHERLKMSKITPKLCQRKKSDGSENISLKMKDCKDKDSDLCKEPDLKKKKTESLDSPKYKHERLTPSQKVKSRLCEKLSLNKSEQSKSKTTETCNATKHEIENQDSHETKKSDHSKIDGANTMKHEPCEAKKSELSKIDEVDNSKKIKPGKAEHKREHLKMSWKILPKLCPMKKFKNSKRSGTGTGTRKTVALSEKLHGVKSKISKDVKHRKLSKREDLEKKLENSLTKEEIQSLCKNLLKKHAEESDHVKSHKQSITESKHQEDTPTKSVETKDCIRKKGEQEKTVAVNDDNSHRGEKKSDKNPGKNLRVGLNCRIFFKSLKEAINMKILKEGFRNAIHWQKIKTAVKENVKMREIIEGFKKGLNLKGLWVGLKEGFKLGILGKAIKEGIDCKKIKEGIKGSFNLSKIKLAISDTFKNFKAKIAKAKKENAHKKKKKPPKQRKKTTKPKPGRNVKQCKEIQKTNCDKSESEKVNFTIETLDFLKGNKNIKSITSPYQTLSHVCKATYTKQATPPDPPEKNKGEKAVQEPECLRPRRKKGNIQKYVRVQSTDGEIHLKSPEISHKNDIQNEHPSPETPRSTNELPSAVQQKTESNPPNQQPQMISPQLVVVMHHPQAGHISDSPKYAIIPIQNMNQPGAQQRMHTAPHYVLVPVQNVQCTQTSESSHHTNSSMQQPKLNTETSPTESIQSHASNIHNPSPPLPSQTKYQTEIPIQDSASSKISASHAPQGSPPSSSSSPSHSVQTTSNVSSPSQDSSSHIPNMATVQHSPPSIPSTSSQSSQNSSLPHVFPNSDIKTTMSPVSNSAQSQISQKPELVQSHKSIPELPEGQNVVKCQISVPTSQSSGSSDSPAPVSQSQLPGSSKSQIAPSPTHVAGLTKPDVLTSSSQKLDSKQTHISASTSGSSQSRTSGTHSQVPTQSQSQSSTCHSPVQPLSPHSEGSTVPQSSLTSNSMKSHSSGHPNTSSNVSFHKSESPSNLSIGEKKFASTAPDAPLQTSNHPGSAISQPSQVTGIVPPQTSVSFTHLPATSTSKSNITHSRDPAAKPDPSSSQPPQRTSSSQPPQCTSTPDKKLASTFQSHNSPLPQISSGTVSEYSRFVVRAQKLIHVQEKNPTVQYRTSLYPYFPIFKLLKSPTTPTIPKSFSGANTYVPAVSSTSLTPYCFPSNTQNASVSPIVKSTDTLHQSTSPYKLQSAKSINSQTEKPSITLINTSVPAVSSTSLTPYCFPSSTQNASVSPIVKSTDTLHQSTSPYKPQSAKSINSQTEKPSITATQIQHNVPESSPTEYSAKTPKPIQVIKPSHVMNQETIGIVKSKSEATEGKNINTSVSSQNGKKLDKESILPTQGSTEPQASASNLETYKNSLSDRAEAARRLREAVRAEALQQNHKVEGLKDALKDEVEVDGVIVKQQLTKKKNSFQKTAGNESMAISKLSAANQVLKALVSFYETKINNIKKQTNKDTQSKSEYKGDQIVIKSPIEDIKKKNNNVSLSSDDKTQNESDILKRTSEIPINKESSKTAQMKVQKTPIINEESEKNKCNIPEPSKTAASNEDKSKNESSKIPIGKEPEKNKENKFEISQSVHKEVTNKLQDQLRSESFQNPIKQVQINDDNKLSSEHSKTENLKIAEDKFKLEAKKYAIPENKIKTDGQKHIIANNLKSEREKRASNNNLKSEGLEKRLDIEEKTLSKGKKLHPVKKQLISDPNIKTKEKSNFIAKKDASKIRKNVTEENKPKVEITKQTLKTRTKIEEKLHSKDQVHSHTIENKSKESNELGTGKQLKLKSENKVSNEAKMKSSEQGKNIKEKLKSDNKSQCGKGKTTKVPEKQPVQQIKLKPGEKAINVKKDSLKIDNRKQSGENVNKKLEGKSIDQNKDKSECLKQVIKDILNLEKNIDNGQNSVKSEEKNTNFDQNKMKVGDKNQTTNKKISEAQTNLKSEELKKIEQLRLKRENQKKIMKEILKLINEENARKEANLKEAKQHKLKSEISEQNIRSKSEIQHKHGINQASSEIGKQRITDELKKHSLELKKITFGKKTQSVPNIMQVKHQYYNLENEVNQTQDGDFEFQLYDKQFSLKLEGSRQIQENILKSKRRNVISEANLLKLSPQHIEENILKAREWLTTLNDRLKNRGKENITDIRHVENEDNVNDSQQTRAESKDAEDILRKEIDKYAIDDKRRTEILKDTEISEKIVQQIKDQVPSVKHSGSEPDILKTDRNIANPTLDDISPVSKSIALDQNVLSNIFKKEEASNISQSDNADRVSISVKEKPEDPKAIKEPLRPDSGKAPIKEPGKPDGSKPDIRTPAHPGTSKTSYHASSANIGEVSTEKPGRPNGRPHSSSSDEPELKGFSYHFNSQTIRGRANVAKFTYCLLGLGFIYYLLKPKPRPPPPTPPPSAPDEPL